MASVLKKLQKATFTFTFTFVLLCLDKNVYWQQEPVDAQKEMLIVEGTETK